MKITKTGNNTYTIENPSTRLLAFIRLKRIEKNKHINEIREIIKNKGQ